MYTEVLYARKVIVSQWNDKAFIVTLTDGYVTTIVEVDESMAYSRAVDMYGKDEVVDVQLKG